MCCRCTTRRIREPSSAAVSAALGTSQLTSPRSILFVLAGGTPALLSMAQVFPHLDHTRFQSRSQLFVGRFGCLALRGRKNRIADHNLEWRESLERLVPRPGFVKSLNGYGHNRNLQVNGQNGRTLFESFWRAINRALAFGVENEGASLPQAERARAHGWNQIRVRIHDHNPQRMRQPQHESLSEDFACSHCKKPVKHLRRQHACQYHRIDKALVIGRDNVCTSGGQLLHAAHMQIQAVKAPTWMRRETMYQNVLSSGCGWARETTAEASGSSARMAFQPANVVCVPVPLAALCRTASTRSRTV